MYDVAGMWSLTINLYERKVRPLPWMMYQLELMTFYNEKPYLKKQERLTAKSLYQFELSSILQWKSQHK